MKNIIWLIKNTLPRPNRAGACSQACQPPPRASPWHRPLPAGPRGMMVRPKAVLEPSPVGYVGWLSPSSLLIPLLGAAGGSQPGHRVPLGGIGDAEVWMHFGEKTWERGCWEHPLPSPPVHRVPAWSCQAPAERRRLLGGPQPPKGVPVVPGPSGEKGSSAPPSPRTRCLSPRSLPARLLLSLAFAASFQLCLWWGESKRRAVWDFQSFLSRCTA